MLIHTAHIDSIDDNLEDSWFYTAGSDLVIVLGLGFELVTFFDADLIVCFDFGFISHDPMNSSFGDVFEFSDMVLESDIAIDLSLITAWIIAFTLSRDYANYLTHNDIEKTFSIMNKAFNLMMENTCNSEFSKIITELQKQLPQTSKDRRKLSNNRSISLKAWYLEDGFLFADKLRKTAMISRGIDPAWKFEEQKLLLNQYCSANKLIAVCLNDSAVDSQVRQEIEETLLLPIAEIEKRKDNIPTHGE